ncbi:MAG: helix-turn-helix domain-containing protein [Oleiphilaceae bacterium]|nr:helix-turn-helix domain-containing protein [Oleiphilaceae bacterium]
MPESPQTRRAREKQARYESILDAAERVFTEQGYEKTAMEDIARQAQLSRALLYVYFRDKAAIQRGIMFRAGESLRQRFTRACDSASNGLTRIAHMGQAYYRFSLEQPLYFEALTQAASARMEAPEEEAHLMACKEEATMALMAGAIERGLEDGSISRERIRDPLQTALYLRGSLHGVIMLCQQKAQAPGSLSAVADQQLVAHTLQMLTLSLQP